jgi:hypothetical protein
VTQELTAHFTHAAVVQKKCTPKFCIGNFFSVIEFVFEVSSIPLAPCLSTYFSSGNLKKTTELTIKVSSIPLAPCLSTYFSSGNLKKTTELTIKAPPVQNTSSVKLNTSICLRFMYITCKKNQPQTDRQADRFDFA